MLIAFCCCRSASRLSHADLISSFSSYVSIRTPYLSSPIFGRLPIHSQFQSLAVFYYSVYFTIAHSESILISYALVSPCAQPGSISVSSFLFSHCASDSDNSKSQLPDVEGKGIVAGIVQQGNYCIFFSTGCL